MNLPVFIHIKDKWHRISQEEILWARCNGNYIEIVTCNRKYHVYGALQKIKETLDSSIFYQIHRSCLVNIFHINAINRKYVEVGREQLPLSEKYRRQLFEVLPMI